MEPQARSTCIMNIVISTLYSEGFWIPAQEGLRLGAMLNKFMVLYGRMASVAFSRGLARFQHVPKGHMIHHHAQVMQAQALLSDWVENPLATANQMQEDYIGRPSRISRRVHVARLHTRVMQRSLLATAQALRR